jgi:hypothetical protein
MASLMMCTVPVARIQCVFDTVGKSRLPDKSGATANWHSSPRACRSRDNFTCPEDAHVAEYVYVTESICCLTKKGERADQ